MLIDEVVQDFKRRSSSAWAKYAPASFRISLARRSSLTSRSRSLMRCCSVVVAPGRSYFDTNTGHHHHFFVETDGELHDFPSDEVTIAGLPAPPDVVLLSMIAALAAVSLLRAPWRPLGIRRVGRALRTSRAEGHPAALPDFVDHGQQFRGLAGSALLLATMLAGAAQAQQTFKLTVASSHPATLPWVEGSTTAITMPPTPAPLSLVPYAPARSAACAVDHSSGHVHCP